MTQEPPAGPLRPILLAVTVRGAGRKSRKEQAVRSLTGQARLADVEGVPGSQSIAAMRDGDVRRFSAMWPSQEVTIGCANAPAGA
jgi:hypothetical protein